MALTRKAGSATLILPSETNATTAAPADTSTTKASDAPGPRHVRVHRSAGTSSERIIRPAALLAFRS